MLKKIFAILLLSVFVAGISAGCAQQAPAPAAQGGGAVGETNWPTRPVTVIVPFNPGGDTDFYARLYATFLEDILGQTITVINVDGAGGTVGATQASVAANDGYTVLFYHTGNMFVNVLLGTTELDHNDFAISNIAVLDDTNVLVASPDAGFADAEDFLARARANPGAYNAATTISGFSFFTLRLMELAGDFRVNPVDVGGAAAMIPSVLGGHTELAKNSFGVFRQHIESGDMVPLMFVGHERNPNFPDVPTATEMGLEGAIASRAYFFAFPLGTDPAILHRLSDAVYEVQQLPEFAPAIRDAFAVEPFFLGTPYVQQFMDDMWADMSQYQEYLLAQ